MRKDAPVEVLNKLAKIDQWEWCRFLFDSARFDKFPVPIHIFFASENGKTTGLCQCINLGWQDMAVFIKPFLELNIGVIRDNNASEYLTFHDFKEGITKLTDLLLTSIK